MNNQSSKPTSQKPTPSALMWVVLIVVLITAGTGIYLLWQDYGTTNTNVNAGVNANSVSNINTVDTSDWGAYENTEFGFRTQYPQNYIVRQIENDEGSFIQFVDKQYLNTEVSFPYISVQMIDNTEELTLDEWVQKQIKDNNFKIIDTFLTPKNQTIITYGKDGSGQIYYATQFDEDLVIILVFHSGREEVNQVGSGVVNNLQSL